MNFAMLSRRALFLGLAVCLVLGALIVLPWLSPERGVERAWSGVLEAIEDNDSAALGKYLGADYRDAFGQDRAGALELAANLRRHFVTCSLRRERAELVMDPSGRSALTRAVIRLGGQGSPVATAAAEASAASDTATVFRWRRNSSKPWDWRLVSVENPEAARALRRFNQEAAKLGF